jgi:hypothetical protein
MPALLDGPDRSLPRIALTDRRSRALEHGVALDYGHLRLLRGGIPDHDGNARRPGGPASSAPARRRGVRRCLCLRGLLDERRNADRVARASGRRRGDPRALDAVSHPQHVPRPWAADVRHWRLGDELLRRRGARPLARRCAARVLLVGLGVPARRSGDGAPARSRASTPSGVPRSRCRAPGSRQRRPFDRRRTRCRLRAETHRRERTWLVRGGVDRCRLRGWIRLPSSPTCAGRSVDRSQSVSVALVQRRLGRKHAEHCDRLRNLSLHRPVPPAGAGALPPQGRSVDRPVGGRVHRGLDARARGRPSSSTGPSSSQAPSFSRPSASGSRRRSMATRSP